ncbi:hypothetical protein GQ53DRAFT_856611 [Thozetella sp. PMI_491]|nr:hypothetical protein GQ53DRAFT_856611 [Thozetella sp. PMI_491]
MPSALQLGEFVVDSTESPKLDKVLYVGASGGTHQTFALSDVTNAASVSGSRTMEGSTTYADSGDAAKEAAVQQEPLLRISRKSLMSSVLRAEDASGAAVAWLSKPLLSFGKWCLTFPAQSPHSSHAIEMKPTSTGKRTYGFIQESVPFFWDMEDKAGARKCTLWKAINGRRREVARFEAKRARDREGILAVDEQGVSAVVAGLTCIALLNRVDSFEK